LRKEVLKEFGKGLINLANLIGGFSVINGIFGNGSKLPLGITIFVVGYIFVSLYVGGLILIDEGEKKNV